MKSSFKHGGSSVQFKVSFEQNWTKVEKTLLFQHQTTETTQTECQNVTNVAQMLANRLQGSFIPQIKRIPPSKDISFDLLWIKCQFCYAIVLWDICNGLPHSYWILNKMKEIPQSCNTSILSPACAEDGTIGLWYCPILRKRIRNYYNHQNLFSFIVNL